jgi:hypothetical protein
MMDSTHQGVTALRQNALERLNTRGAPLFAVLDAARTGRILKLLQRSKEEYESLYEGPEAGKLSKVAPYLISLPAGCPDLEHILSQGWGESWGIYLSCGLPFKDLRRHLRRFLLVESEETREQLYFRFYDPRVLRVFLPMCTPAQRDEFFGEIHCFWMESREGELLRFPRSTRQT